MESQTRQRITIRRTLESENRPITAQEIHHLAKKSIPRLGISTVYRLMRRMLEEHQLVRVDFPGQPTRYELPTHSIHSHFICSRCQKVFDLPENLETPPNSVPKGFHYEGYELVLFGRCPDCNHSTD